MRTVFKLSALAIATAAFSSAVAKEKIFKFYTDGAPTHMDPVQSSDTYANIMVTSLYDTLYEYKYLERPFTLKPSLADGMPKVSEDGLTYTIKLKKGVHYIDDPSFKDGKGREVTAHDIEFVFKRHFDPKSLSKGAWLWKGKIKGLDEWKEKGSDYSKPVEGLKVIDDHTIQFTLTKQFPQFIYTLAMGFSAAHPKEAVDKYGEKFGRHPVGSGIWKLDDFNTKRAVISKNPNYRKDVFNAEFEGFDKAVHGEFGIKELDGKQMPFVDKVQVNFISQSTAGWASFSKGSEIQNIRVPSELFSRVVDGIQPLKLKKGYQGKYYTRLETEAGFVYSVFNMDDPNFGYVKGNPKQDAKNKALRCAIRKAFDWSQRNRRFYSDIGLVFPGVIPPGVDGYNPDFDRSSITYDLEGAKKLLKDAGWKPSEFPTFVYGSTSSSKAKQFFEQMRGFLTRMGYPINKIESKWFATFGDFSKATSNKELPYISQGWSLDYPDAENTMQLFYGPNGSPGSNAGNYDNPEYNKLYDQALSMQPSPERTKLYNKMNQIIIDDCVAISGLTRQRIHLWQKNIVAYPVTNTIGNYFKYVDVK